MRQESHFVSERGQGYGQTKCPFHKKKPLDCQEVFLISLFVSLSFTSGSGPSFSFASLPYSGWRNDRPEPCRLSVGCQPCDDLLGSCPWVSLPFNYTTSWIADRENFVSHLCFTKRERYLILITKQPLLSWRCSLPPVGQRQPCRASLWRWSAHRLSGRSHGRYDRFVHQRRSW